MSARVVLVLGILGVVVATVAAAAPRPETPGERVARIASELRCPVCQGLSVADSPSDTAREMRALVEQRVAEGKSDEGIRAEFRQAYGEWIFLSPPLLGPRGLVWLLPLLAIAAGALVVAMRIGRAPPIATPSADQLALLRERALGEDTLE